VRVYLRTHFTAPPAIDRAPARPRPAWNNEPPAQTGVDGRALSHEASRLVVRNEVNWGMYLPYIGRRRNAMPVGGATLQAEEIHRLWYIFLAATIFVGGTAYFLIFWNLIKYRRKEDRLPPQFSSQPVIEGLCIGSAVAIVIVLFVFSNNVERFVDLDPPNAPVRIRITGYQWSWRFEYLGGGPVVNGTPQNPPALVLPVGETVHFELTSADVDHSFFVPEFYFKRMAIPGYTSGFDLKVMHAGEYRGECGEFCGLDHAFMNFTVSARSPQAFASWLVRQRGGGLASRGRVRDGRRSPAPAQ
jgi:cytochrome c oxidase subunit 2